MTVLLKLKDSASADFVEFSSTEENYIAYQAGLQLASDDSSDVGSLAFGIHGTQNNIGSFTNTAYDSAVGTGGDGSFLTFTTTTTPIRQTIGTVTPSGTNYRIPVTQRDSDGQRIIQEMSDADEDSLLTRIGSRIFTSDYPGSYKLATSTPAGGYTLALSDVTTDTRADGASVQKNIYRRTSMTAPTKVLPFAIKRSSGATGTYQGLQLMTDAQVKYSIGTRLKNKIASSTSGVGTYKVLSSATGTPTNAGFTGTWQSKGAATDTRNAIVDVNYTRNRASTYARLRNSNYTADYTRSRSSTYARSSNVTRTSTYSATYTKTRVSTYLISGFLGNYTGNYSRTTSGAFTRTSVTTSPYASAFTGNFSGNYSRLLAYTGNYAGVGGNYNRSSTVVANYARTSTNVFTGNFTRDLTYVGNYSSDFLGEYSAAYQRVSTQGNFSRNFIGNYGRAFTRTRQSSYTRNSTRDSQRTSTRDSQRTIAGNFTGDFTGNYARNFAGNFTRTSIGTMGYETTFSRGRRKNGDIQFYVGNFVGQNYYTRNRVAATGSLSGVLYATPGNSTSMYWRVPLTGSYTPQLMVYDGQGAGNFWIQGGEITGGTQSQRLITQEKHEQITEYNGSTTIPSFKDFLQASDATYIVYMQNITAVKIGAYEIRKGSYRGTYYNDPVYDIRRRTMTSYVGNYAGDFVGNYARNFARGFTRNSTRNSATSFTGNFAGNFLGNFTGDFTGNYGRNFIGNYSRNYTRTRASTYTGLAHYSRNFAGNFIGNYSRDFSTNFTGNYSRNYAGNYTGDYTRNFTGNYSRTFAGNYAGATIGSGNTNIETYTLYVRTA